MLHRAFDEQQLDFLHLCSLGDEQRVQSALMTGRVDINYRHKQNGWSALHWAACRGHENVCLLLIEAGYPLNSIDHSGRTPYDVCPEEKKHIREILQPASEDEEEDMVQSTTRRRASEVPQSTPGFVPNYVRNPPFPYTHKTSFDNSYASPPMTPGSPGSPGVNSPTTYSYGRRDSFNKTRFLLVRTSVEKGKETYKRVTLPGGSDIERLKSTIEKACKGKVVDMIFTLPENDLVETEEQIHAFKDCQKIDVIFKKENREQTPAVTGDTTKPQIMSEQETNNPKDDVIEKDYSATEPENVDVPKSYEQDIEVESSNNSEESTEEKTEEPKLIPLATRQSLDSDPGDFVKVEQEDEKLAQHSPAVAGIAAAIPIINAQVEEEAKNQPQTEVPTFTAPSSKATVVEESNQVPEDRKSSDIAAWIHQNPDIVRNVATAAAVAGVAGLGYYVYVKRFAK